MGKGASLLSIVSFEKNFRQMLLISGIINHLKKTERRLYGKSKIHKVIFRYNRL